MSKTLLFLLGVVVLCAGCASKDPTAPQGRPGQKIIYVTEDEGRLFSEVYAAVVAHFAYRPMSKIYSSHYIDAKAGQANKHIRGYTITDTSGPERSASCYVHVFPAITSVGGAPTTGYYVSIMSAGTFPGLAAQKLDQDIQRRLTAFARPVIAPSITPGKYRKTQKEWSKTMPPSLRGARHKDKALENWHQGFARGSHLR